MKVMRYLLKLYPKKPTSEEALRVQTGQTKKEIMNELQRIFKD